MFQRITESNFSYRGLREETGFGSIDLCCLQNGGSSWCESSAMQL